MIQCLLAALPLPVTLVVLRHRTEHARPAELMATSNLWTRPDGINPITCGGSRRAVTTQSINPKPCALFGAFKVILQSEGAGVQEEKAEEPARDGTEKT